MTSNGQCPPSSATKVKSWCMWPGCDTPIQDPDREIVFVTWGAALFTVPNAEEMWPKHGLVVCLCMILANPLLKKYEHKGHIEESATVR